MIVDELRELLADLDGKLVVVLYDNEGSIDELFNHSLEYEFDGINAISPDYKYDEYMNNAVKRQSNRRKAIVLSNFDIPKNKLFL